MTITDTEFSRLVDVGFAAAHRGEVALARELFEPLLRYKDSAPARIGLALPYLVSGDFARAESILKDEVLAKNPADAEALALLGLNQTLAGHAEEGAALLERVPKESAGGKLVAALSALPTLSR